jgi:predicted 3-demethylubiquinone-9 3-methyltransferase (glyoxalase superfamily)
MKNELAEKKGGIEKSTKKIVPHLWFDKEAKEAAKSYTSIFKDLKITTDFSLSSAYRRK